MRRLLLAAALLFASPAWAANTNCATSPCIVTVGAAADTVTIINTGTIVIDKIEAIGAAGSGFGGSTNTRSGGGGGAGAYAAITSASITSGVAYVAQVGVNQTGTTQNVPTTSVCGAVGANTCMKDNTGNFVVAAQGGAAGGASGGPAGTAANSIGSTKNDGGAGGNGITGAGNQAGGGGGGAGGPSGAGTVGANAIAGGTFGAGGQGDDSAGGVGGASAGAKGTSGIEFASGVGSGGGGAGGAPGASSPAADGGAGGAFGAAGGGAGSNASGAGSRVNGRDGVLIITYHVATSAGGWEITGGGVFAPGGGGAAAAYVGPGDIVTFSAWYGLRAYSAAIAAAGTQTLVNLRQTTSAETCDVLVATSGGMGLTANCSGASNGKTAYAFCLDVTCAVTKLYDQTGGARDVLQATAANQPVLVFNGGGITLPFMQITNTTQILTAAAAFTPATGLVSLSAVGNRVSANSTSPNTFTRENGSNNRLRSFSGAGAGWELVGGTSGTLNNTAGTAAAWHVGHGVINGASSVLNVDGTEATGTVTGNTTAVAPNILVFAGTANTADQVEGGFADNVAWTAGNRTSLCNNAYKYWGTPTSC